MHLKRYYHARDFLRDIGAFLREAPEMNNLMLGLLHPLHAQDENPDALFLTLQDGDRRLVSMMSGLHLILFANTTEPLIYEEAVRYLDAEGIDYPGIIGPLEICEAFKHAYEKKTGRTMVEGMRQRIFVIRSIAPCATPGMSLVAAEIEHLAFLMPWMRGWFNEIGEVERIASSEEQLKKMIHDKCLYVLEHEGTFVSMAAGIRPFMRTISVGYVYTPPEKRNRGYATRCVGRLTEKLLEDYEMCTLYTDLANPTSNSIYRKLGYRPVGDSIVYKKV